MIIVPAFCSIAGLTSICILLKLRVIVNSIPVDTMIPFQASVAPEEQETLLLW
jgi:hypothetical protein